MRVARKRDRCPIRHSRLRGNDDSNGRTGFDERSQQIATASEPNANIAGRNTKRIDVAISHFGNDPLKPALGLRVQEHRIGFVFDLVVVRYSELAAFVEVFDMRAGFE